MLERFFGLKSRKKEVQPAIFFGRYSDNNKTIDKTKQWNHAEELFKEKPTDVVIFPWNIKSEIANFLRSNLGDQVRLWCAIPEMHQIAEK